MRQEEIDAAKGGYDVSVEYDWADALKAARAVYEETGSMVQAVKAARKVSPAFGLREVLNVCKGARVRERWKSPDRPEEAVARALEMAVGEGLMDLVNRVSEELGVERRFVWSEIVYVANRSAGGYRP